MTLKEESATIDRACGLISPLKRLMYSHLKVAPNKGGKEHRSVEQQIHLLVITSIQLLLISDVFPNYFLVVADRADIEASRLEHLPREISPDTSVAISLNLDCVLWDSLFFRKISITLCYRYLIYVSKIFSQELSNILQNLNA